MVSCPKYHELLEAPSEFIPPSLPALWDTMGELRLASLPRKFPNRRDGELGWMYHCEIWQASRELYCRDTCELYERLQYSDNKFCAFESLQDLTIRCLCHSEMTPGLFSVTREIQHYPLKKLWIHLCYHQKLQLLDENKVQNHFTGCKIVSFYSDSMYRGVMRVYLFS